MCDDIGYEICFIRVVCMSMYVVQYNMYTDAQVHIMVKFAIEEMMITPNFTIIIRSNASDENAQIPFPIAIYWGEKWNLKRFSKTILNEPTI